MIEITLIPVAIVVVIIIAIIAWKFLKFAVKKVFAVLQGLTALALLGYVFLTADVNIAIAFGMAGFAILFGAVSNIFS